MGRSILAIFSRHGRPAPAPRNGVPAAGHGGLELWCRGEAAGALQQALPEPALLPYALRRQASLSGSASETVLTLMGSRKAAAAEDLLVAAEKGDAGAVGRLLARGGHPDESCGLKGFTALHYAGKGGHHAVVALLLRHGASATRPTEVSSRCR